MNIPSARRVANLVIQARTRRLAIKLRQMEILMSLGKSFGVLAGYIQPESEDPDQIEPRHQNKIRHGNLLADLSRMGYRFKIADQKSYWTKNDIKHPEKSILVPNIKPRDLFALGMAYKQDAVIYKSPDGVLGMYNFKTRSVMVSVKADGSIPWEQAVDKSLYSMSRNNSFGFDFATGDLPWDLHSVVTANDVMAGVKEGSIKPFVKP